MIFSTVLTFLLCLSLASIGIQIDVSVDEAADQPWIPTWEADLWCDLYAGSLQAQKGQACRNHSQGDGSLCHMKNVTSSLIAERSQHSGVWLNILCRIGRTGENVICSLKHHNGPTDPGRLSLSLHRMSLGQDGSYRMEGTYTCDSEENEEKEEISCFTAPYVKNSQYFLRASISNCTHSAHSPVMSVVLWKQVKPEAPVNLQYNMSTEGAVKLSWTAPKPHTGPFAYEVRYFSKDFPSLLEVVKGASRPQVALSGLSSGVNYTAQVRCRNSEESGLWSDWSQPSYIYLHEVSYLPERLFASAGSNVTVYCIFNNRSFSARSVVWWLNYHQKVPENQYSVISDHVSSVTLFNVRPPRQRGYDVLHCCRQTGEKSLCSYPYAQIYITDFNAKISCETNGDLSSMTCWWNASQWAEVRFLYRQSNLPCDMLEEEVGLAHVDECPAEGRGLNKCTLQPLLLASCYLMWLEVRKEEGSVRSRPVYITPMELVKPHPPFDVNAVTIADGSLSIRWKRHELPVYELQYEVRYTAEKDHVQWKVHRYVFNQSAVIPVSDPCVGYTVQVRCKRLNGSGYWSDWSSARNTTILNFRAPHYGPDFWRVLRETTAGNTTNVTLLLKPVPIEKQLSCVEGYEIHHQTSGGLLWVETIDPVPSYTFLWSEEVHSITVVAFNSLGSSNNTMTLSRRAKSQTVQSFTSVLVNSSCVSLSWALLPNSSSPASFIIEWKVRSREKEDSLVKEQINWARLPPNTRIFYLNDLFTSEEFQFVLVPIFENGEGEPVLCQDARRSPQAEQAAYMLMMVIAFVSVVLLVTLTVSQHQMMKLAWKDVPNPNNCSWAQGVDFKKVETIESLFRHPERLTSRPLLLESEAISEAVIVEKIASPELCPPPPLLERETSPLPGSRECSAQSGITYATVLHPEGSGLLHKLQESISSSSDEGNFSANLSDISGSFKNGIWELENGAGCESDARRSCSYNSTEEFSEGSEHEDEAQEKGLHYLGAKAQGGGPVEQGEESGVRFLQPSLESNPMLGLMDSTWDEAGSNVQRYMPQFRTAPSKINTLRTQRMPDM